MALLTISIKAQKTTEKFATYDITIMPLKALSSKASFHIQTPFTKEGIKYTEKYASMHPPTDSGMTSMIRRSGSKSSSTTTKPEPVDLTKTYLSKIYIKTDNYSSDVSITFKTTNYIIDSYKLYTPSISNSAVAFTYSYKAELEIVGKDGEIIANPIFTNNKHEEILVKEMSANKNLVNSFNKLKKQYLSEKQKRIDKQKKKIRSSFEEDMIAFEEMYRKKFNTYFSKTMKTNFAEEQIGKDLLAAKDYLFANYNTIVQRVTMPVYGVKGKGDYTKINESQLKAQSVIKRISASKKNFITAEEVKTVLKECIVVWTDEASKLEKNNKKARINNKVYAGLILNIANANLLLFNFEATEKALADFYSVYKKKFMVSQGSYRYYVRKMEETIAVVKKAPTTQISIFSEEQMK